MKHKYNAIKKSILHVSTTTHYKNMEYNQILNKLRNTYSVRCLAVSKELTVDHAVHKYKWFSDFSLEDTAESISYKEKCPNSWNTPPIFLWLQNITWLLHIQATGVIEISHSFLLICLLTSWRLCFADMLMLQPYTDQLKALILFAFLFWSSSLKTFWWYNDQGPSIL